MLRPGMSVLDVGCGAGAITAGIATAVGSSGRVVGIDRDQSLLALSPAAPNLTFETGDALDLNYQSEFDIVTAARTLQWISRPADAIERMTRALKPGGCLVVLDYNHENNAWEPDPPADFLRFYHAFLDWRSVNGWDNRMASALPGLFEAAGLAGIGVQIEDEISERGDPDFEEAASIWLHVAETLGAQAGMTPGPAYSEWVRDKLRKQTLELRSVTGYRATPTTAPPGPGAPSPRPDSTQSPTRASL